MPLSKRTPQKVTIKTLLHKKQKNEPITMLTAYDYPTAMILEKTGIDSILVGDSLGMVVLGYENTLPVTMDDMIHHAKAVSRGSKYALKIGDLPFLSYQISIEEAVRNSGRFMQEADMDAVKLEGGREHIDTIKKISSVGIPVMGHLGLTPQRFHQFGGFKAQGKTAKSARILFEDSILLQSAGCFGIVLEAVPGKLAAYISKHLDIPTIGIGAGVGCDGQVLVTHDLIGLFDKFTPKFVKKYAEINAIITDAVVAFDQEVKSSVFPGKQQTIEMTDEEWEKFLNEIE